MSNAGMRVAIYQGPAEPGSVARNLSLLEAKAAQAASREARLLICPEMFLSGYNVSLEQVTRLAEPANGPPPAVVELDGIRVGLLICYDVEFPDAVRLLALAGADLVAVPTALMEPIEAVARTVVPARAIENQIFVAYANRCGRDGDLRYCGLSCVVGPDGADLVRGGGGEALVFADLDLDRLRVARMLNVYLRGRRPELYAPLADATGTPLQRDGA